MDDKDLDTFIDSIVKTMKSQLEARMAPDGYGGKYPTIWGWEEARKKLKEMLLEEV